LLVSFLTLATKLDSVGALLMETLSSIVTLRPENIVGIDGEEGSGSFTFGAFATHLESCCPTSW
jgi:hypothetical protein